MSGYSSPVARALAGAWRLPAPALTMEPGQLAALGAEWNSQGLAGFLWARVRVTPGFAADPRFDAIHAAAGMLAITNVQATRALERATGCLQQAGIDPVVVKGWAVRRNYPDPDRRYNGDLDLCVPAHQFDQARALLRDPAFAGSGVDLHRDFDTAGPEPLDALPATQLFAESRAVPLGSGTVRVLAPEDHLRLVCVHLLRHGLIRPVWLVDVAAMVENATGSFDWDRARGPGPWRSDWTIAAVGLAHHVLGAELAGCGFADLARAVPDWLVRAVHAVWDVGPAPWTRAGYLRHPHRILSRLRASPLVALESYTGPLMTMPWRRRQLSSWLTSLQPW